MDQDKFAEIDINNQQVPLVGQKIIEEEYALLKIFKSFDFHKKLPREITQPSYGGALSLLFYQIHSLLVSVITFVLIILLIKNEVYQYFEPNIISEMILEQNIRQNLVPVNIHIKVKNFPCGLLSLDIADTIGQHQVNIEGTLRKISIDQQGNELEEEQMHSMHASHPHDQSTFISLETVPGNFHISLHAFGGIIQMLQQQNMMPNIDLSHEIVSLSFGEEGNNKRIKRKYKNQGLSNPLDNTQFLASEGTMGFHYIYFLNIVPTQYRLNYRTNLQSYQFIATKGSYSTDHMPVIIFKYEFAGVSVQYQFENKLLMHLVVSLCGIIGGIFVVAGVLEFFNNKLLCLEFKKKTEQVIQK